MTHDRCITSVIARAMTLLWSGRFSSGGWKNMDDEELAASRHLKKQEYQVMLTFESVSRIN